MAVFLRLRQLLRRGRGQEGTAAVEFAVLLLPLMLLIGGVLDFGHAYYIQQVITNASREGARYGVKYQVDSSTGLAFAPSALTPSISNYVKSNLGYAGLLGSDANLTVTPPGGAGYPSNTVGAMLTVTVTADKHWFFLGGLLGFPNPKTLTATTAMTLER